MRIIDIVCLWPPSFGGYVKVYVLIVIVLLVGWGAALYGSPPVGD
jgi:hypothetical protein